MLDLGTVRPGSTIRIPFSSFDKDDGSSITMTNYAAADILVYKDGGTTERASTAGFTATTDFDSKTGKHVAVIDLADNTTAGFYAAGSEYLVAIDSVTVDSVTTGGWVARFRIGYPSAILDTTIASLSSQTSFTLTVGPAEDDSLNGMWCVIHDVASAVQFGKALISDYTGSTKTVTLAAGTTFTAAATDNFSVIDLAPVQPTVTGRTLDISTGGEAGIDWANVGSPTTTVNLSGTTTNVVNTATAVTTVNGLAANTITATSIASDAITAAKIADGAIDAATFAAGAINAAAIASDAITDAKVASDVTIASVTGSVGSVTGNVGGNVTGSVGSVAAGGITAASIATGAIDADALAADAVAEIADGVWDEATSGHASAGTYGLAVSDILTDTAVIGAAGAGLSAIPWNAAWDAEVQSEVNDGLVAYGAATASDVTTAAANVSVDEIQASALADLFNTNSGTTYGSAVAGSVVAEIADNAGGSALTAAGIADAVWDEVLSGHAGAGSAGEALAAAGTAGDPWTTALPGSYSSGQAGYIIGNNLNATVSSRLASASYTAPLDAAGTRSAVGLASANLDTQLSTIDTVVDSILVDTAEIGTAGAGLTNINLPDQTMNITGNITGNLSGSVGSVSGAVGSVTGNVGGNVTGSIGSLSTQAKADVNAEVVDALATDTYGEPGQGAPAATASIAAKVNYLYKSWRNRKTQTGTTWSLYADDGTTVDQKSTVADDGTTASRTEIASGP